MPPIRSLLAVASIVGSLLSSPVVGKKHISSFISDEKRIALNGILANIGPSGELSSGAASGIVIASPSTVNPNYLYTWTRDSALTMKTIIDEFIAGNKKLQATITNYIKAMAVEQTLTNPSGNFHSGAGLGEPKFLISIASFNGPWGRPQRDGPALRAIALMSYVKYLITAGQSDNAKNVVWPIVANDLNYVAEYWNRTGFDLWEEVSGSSFFTIQNQHRALVQGSLVAKTLGLSCTSCDSQAPEILCFLQSFWNGQTVVANINENNGRSGKDANTLLGAISTFDIAGSCTDGSFQPCNSKILASHKQLVDAFRSLYTLNTNKTAGSPAAIGRYPEDVYYNGNPWYLCTLAAAEVLYDAVAQWKMNGQIVVDSISLPFFKDLYPAATAATYEAESAQYDAIAGAVSTYADGFVGIVQTYLPKNGSIGEQYSRTDGTPLSAYALTWSFASFVTMAERQDGYYPASWGSQSAANAPATCAGTSAPGTYVPAVAAGAPNNTNGCEISVTFDVNATTYFGENIFLQGNSSVLGSYVQGNALGMSAGGYSSSRPLWDLTAQFPAGVALSYNYARQESGGNYIYESINRTLAIPACGGSAITTNDAITT